MPGPDGDTARFAQSPSPQASLPQLDSAQASFEQLVATAEQLGANKGLLQVIDLYRNWIAAQSGGARHLYAAWFNLGVELSCCGDLRAAMLAYRTSLAMRPDFSLAAINLGLLLERSGETEAALAIWRSTIRQGSAKPPEDWPKRKNGCAAAC
jgi:tetratricopeptide (TPR) repeat protein